MLRRHNTDGDRGAVRGTELENEHGLGAEMTVVGRDAQLEGTLVSDESIRIDGQARGQIAAGGDVILSAQSDVEADIHARNVVMSGTLRGTITARTKTRLAQGGRLDGMVRCQVLIVEEGAVFSGQSNIGPDRVNGKGRTSGYPDDELQTAYLDATRRAADWYRSRFAEPETETDAARSPRPGAPVRADRAATVASADR
jgi:cytoskeletal protein CcmA (bactofilin family)